MFEKKFRTIKHYSTLHTMYFYYVERTILGVWVRYMDFTTAKEKDAIEYACNRKKGLSIKDEYTYITDDSC